MKPIVLRRAYAEAITGPYCLNDVLSELQSIGSIARYKLEPSVVLIWRNLDARADIAMIADELTSRAVIGLRPAERRPVSRKKRTKA